MCKMASNMVAYMIYNIGPYVAYGIIALEYII